MVIRKELFLYIAVLLATPFVSKSAANEDRMQLLEAQIASLNELISNYEQKLQNQCGNLFNERDAAYGQARELGFGLRRANAEQTKELNAQIATAVNNAKNIDEQIKQQCGSIFDALDVAKYDLRNLSLEREQLKTDMQFPGQGIRIRGGVR